VQVVVHQFECQDLDFRMSFGDYADKIHACLEFRIIVEDKRMVLWGTQVIDTSEFFKVMLT
jgi:hypothetical protein